MDDGVGVGVGGVPRGEGVTPRQLNDQQTSMERQSVDADEKNTVRDVDAAATMFFGPHFSPLEKNTPSKLETEDGCEIHSFSTIFSRAFLLAKLGNADTRKFTS